MSFSTMSNFMQRLTVSAATLIVLIVAVYFSNIPVLQPVFTVLFFGVIGAALWEFYHLAQMKGWEPLVILGLVSTFCYIVTTYLATQLPYAHLWPFLVLFLTLIAAFHHFFFTGNSPTVNLALTFFGLIYLTIPLTLMLNINFTYGRWWLVYLLLVAKMTDTGAYFFGKQFGQHKLVPYISPKKTWEGAIGGFLVGMIVSIFFNIFYNYPMSLLHSILLGAIVSVLAQLGDLAESLLKRDAGAKDSSHLPGLGGMLDIVDSLVLTTPVVYFYLRFMGET